MNTATFVSATAEVPYPVRQVSRWAAFAFIAALIFVGASSFYDGYLVIRTGDMIEQFEQNPVGLYLIHYNGGNPSIFLRLKAAGTIVALTALAFLHRRAPRLASRVAGALVIFQTALLCYLDGAFC